MTAMSTWSEDYQALIRRLPDLAARARLTVGGFSTCVDVYLSLREVVAQFDEGGALPKEARDLLTELRRRAASGVGGELFVDWPAGRHWIDTSLSGQRAIGGTNAQAAYMLSLLGAPALIALEDRSEEQLGVLHPNTLIASSHGVLPVARAQPSGTGRPPHYIFEFTAGDRFGDVSVPRSSRVIVRFGHDPLHRDPDFVLRSTDEAAIAGAGVICGFNEIETDNAKDELSYAADVARGWRRAGLRLVHLELGAFPDDALRDVTIDRLLPAVTSVGMSLSELNDLTGDGGRPEDRAVRFAEEHDLARMCVHADEWAFSVTLGDPELEREALRLGCLLAASRAAHGYFIKPEGVPDGARFSPPPIREGMTPSGRMIVSCPAPYLEKPAATIGLGDTFLAGTLLVLGGAASDRATDSEPVSTVAGSS